MAKKVELYYRDLCGFCARAESLLKAKGVDYERIDIWADPDQKRKMIERTGGKTTVPQVFADDVYVGDSSKLISLDRDGELDAILGIA